MRLVDAPWEEYFEAVSREVEARGLSLPTQEGTFGICWEEWAAHLGGPTADFREAERLLRQVEQSTRWKRAAAQSMKSEPLRFGRVTMPCSVLRSTTSVG